jgi:hypothetical protein
MCTHFNRSKEVYTDNLVYPLINTIFNRESFIRKEKKGTIIHEIKTDILLSLMFHDIQISKFSVIEVSGNWCNQNRFTMDRNDIAKNLKVILNGIYRKNTLGGNHITNVKLYGLQIYEGQFYVYSLQLICPRLYLFKQEMRFDYPSSMIRDPSKFDSFVENLFAYRSLVLSSMNSLLKFLKIQQTEGIANDVNESTESQ